MASTEENQSITPPSFVSLIPAVRALCNLLKVSGTPGMIIGGVAASLCGQARATEDVDASVLLDERLLSRFLELAAAEGLRPRIPDAIAFAQRSAMLLLEHKPTSVGVDIAIGRLPFEREAIERAQSLIVEDLVIPVATPEDLVVMKAVAHRPQDLQDIRVIIAANPSLDFDHIRAQVREFAGVLEMPELWTDVAGLFPRSHRTAKSTRQKRAKKGARKKH